MYTYYIIIKLFLQICKEYKITYHIYIYMSLFFLNHSANLFNNYWNRFPVLIEWHRCFCHSSSSSSSQSSSTYSLFTSMTTSIDRPNNLLSATSYSFLVSLLLLLLLLISTLFFVLFLIIFHFDVFVIEILFLQTRLFLFIFVRLFYFSLFFRCII